MTEIEPNETAWLIERDDLEGGLHYFANTEHKHFWTTDPNKAERFASEELARICCKGGDRDGSLRVCEHMWITPSARITGDKDRENPVEGAPYGEGLIGRIDQLESKLRATAIEVHRLRSCLRYIEGEGYVDRQSGNANFEYLQRLARSARNDAYTAPSGDVERVAWGVVQDVAELPDRSSPDDWPEAMLVTGEELHLIVCRALAAIAAMRPASGVFAIGDRVTKTKGSAWTGRVVGTYSTALTPEGYAIESENEPGSVQIYPATALRQAGEG